MWKRVFVVVAVSASLLSVRPAGAQDGNPAVAEALFREGQRLLKENAVPEACSKFAESMKLDPTTGTLLNLALCHEKQGKLALAWSEMNQAALQSARAANKDREAFARDKVADLERRLPHARIQIAGSAGVTDLSVDGQPLGAAAWTIPLPVDPGEHVFVFSGGNRRRTMKVSFAEGATQDVTLTSLDDAVPALGAHDAEHESGTTPPPGAGGDESSASTRRTIGFVVGGVGVAGVAVGTIFGVSALGKKSDVDANCVASRCNPAGLAAVDDTRSAATISTVGFGVGLVGLVAGAYLVLTSPRARAAGQLNVSPVLAGSSRGLQIGGAF